MASHQTPQQVQQSHQSQQARPADETTASQNLLRDGWDPNEPGLSPAAVQGGHFGQLFRTPVTGQVYAQPLVVDNPGTSTTAPSSSVIAVTEENWVYSLDGTTGKVNWSLQLGNPWSSAVRHCNDINPYIGITSTPVYDPASQTLYVVALISPTTISNPKPTYWVYALNEQTGAIKWRVPVQGSPINAPAEVFAASQERQRSALLLMNGSLYFSFASFCDFGAYVGYVSGVNVTSHAQTMWSDETGSAADQAGIWMAGSGLMSDGSGRIFLTTGNGISPPAGVGTRPPGELGDAVVRLAVQSNGSLKAADFFSPANAPTLARQDTDFGSGGITGLPFGTSTYPHLAVQVGKDGRAFLLNRDNLGGRETGTGGTDKPVWVGGPYGGSWARPAVFADSGNHDYVYLLSNGNATNDYLRVLKFNGHTTQKPELQLLANSPAKFGISSGSPVVTSNGGDPTSAVVWDVYVTGNSGAGAQLEAFDAVPAAGQATLTQIWSAPLVVASKFSVPATDGGHVYVGTRNDGIHLSAASVYGFGVTSATPLTSAQVSFGSVAVGTAAKTVTATVTATRALQVTGASVSSTTSPVPFTLGTPTVDGKAASFPVALTAGHRLAIPVSYAPTTAVADTGSLGLATNVPGYSTVSVPLAGTGTRAGLAAFPTSLPFGFTNPIPNTPLNGPIPLGGTQTLQVNIINTGTTAETIAAIKPPAAPFSLSGLKPGTVLKAGQATIVTVTYTPSRATSSDAGSFSVRDLAGRTVTVPLTGISVPGNGALVTSPSQVGFGMVRVGTSTTLTVHITNTGNLPVTVSLFLAAGGPFSTQVPIAKGLTINPDDLIALPVTMTPKTRGAAAGTFQIVATYGNGRVEKVALRVSGTGA